LRVMFTDEARFGRMNRPRPCWAPIDTRPEVASQLVREYTYLYGAVCPKDGTCVYLVLPAPDTECFQIFLNVLAKKYARQHILLVVDGAGNHRSEDLVVPANIALEFLPPYSPELNPQENLWDEFMRPIFVSFELQHLRRRAPRRRSTQYAAEFRVKHATPVIAGSSASADGDGRQAVHRP
jgi:hypothetical protein